MWCAVMLATLLIGRAAVGTSTNISDILQSVQDGIIVNTPEPIKVVRGQWRIILVLKDPNVGHALKEKEQIRTIAQELLYKMEHHTDCDDRQAIDQHGNPSKFCMEPRSRRSLINKLKLITADPSEAFKIDIAKSGTNRRRRGWLNIGGSILKKVFGTATVSDINGIKKAIAQTRQQDRHWGHITEGLVTVVDHARKEQTRERKRVNIMYEQLNRLHDTSVNTFNLLNLLDKQILINEHVDYLFLILQEIQREEQHKARIIQDLEAGRLTETLLPTELLEQIFRQVDVMNLDNLPIIWYYENIQTKLNLANMCTE